MSLWLAVTRDDIADYVNFALRLEQSTQAVTHDGVIIRQQNSDHVDPHSLSR